MGGLSSTSPEKNRRQDADEDEGTREKKLATHSHGFSLFHDEILAKESGRLPNIDPRLVCRAMARMRISLIYRDRHSLCST